MSIETNVNKQLGLALVALTIVLILSLVLASRVHNERRDAVSPKPTSVSGTKVAIVGDNTELPLSTSTGSLASESVSSGIVSPSQSNCGSGSSQSASGSISSTTNLSSGLSRYYTTANSSCASSSFYQPSAGFTLPSQE